ncbi:MAG: hypothetical protein EOO07_00150 [Chitinophagaceae bacterium]|nr:MAG: hypothetical protein EOO07_00150 [Chitinophagaceae bacterium]
MKAAFKLFALFAIILVSSCKKDFEVKQNKILLLTKPSGWLTVKVEEKTANGWLDLTSSMGPLAVDNILIFDPYYKWAINEGTLKLPGNPFLIASGEWSFTDNSATKIQFIGGNLAEIVELTETSMQYTVTSGATTNRFTYKHP